MIVIVMAVMVVVVVIDDGGDGGAPDIAPYINMCFTFARSNARAVLSSSLLRRALFFEM